MLATNDLRRHHAAIAGEVSAAMARVAASGWYVLGAEGEAFERDFARYCGVPHAVGVGNGTDALELAMRAVGVGAGDAVITVANAGFYSCTALHAIGAAPRFVDIDPATFLMDLQQLEAALKSGRVAAVIVTHLYGRMHDMERVEAICRGRAPIIEDCAQAHGAERNGRRVGSFGRAAAFSFYPTKNLGGLGDGGAVVTGDDEVAERLRRLRQYGWTEKYSVGVPGGRNTRLDEVQAAILAAKLPLLDGWNARRRQIANRYSEGIAHPEVTTPAEKGADDVAHLYVVRSPRRDALRAHLRAQEIAAEPHYPIPDTRQPIFAGQAFGPLPVTDAAANRVLSLPCFPEMSDAEVDAVVAAVNAWPASASEPEGVR